MTATATRNRSGTWSVSFPKAERMAPRCGPGSCVDGVAQRAQQLMQPGIGQTGLGGDPGRGQDLHAVRDGSLPGEAGQGGLADARVADQHQRAALLERAW